MRAAIGPDDEDPTHTHQSIGRCRFDIHNADVEYACHMLHLCVATFETSSFAPLMDPSTFTRESTRRGLEVT
jgi:hypothetical protein